MGVVRALAWAVIAVMALLALNIALNDGFDHGVGLDVFLAGMSSPWQLFINQDLVAGLWLVCGWILYRQREDRLPDTVAWIWMVMWWGNIVVAAYVLVALNQSGGDAAAFFGIARRDARRMAWRPGLPVRALMLIGAVLNTGFMLVLLDRAGSGVPFAGALLGFLPVTLSLLLLAFPAGRRRPVTA